MELPKSRADRIPPSHPLLIVSYFSSFFRSQLPVSANDAAARELPAVTPLPARVNLSLVFGEGVESRANQAVAAAAASERSASLGEPEDDGNQSHRSHSPAFSQCSATYSNLGKKNVFKKNTCWITHTFIYFGASAWVVSIAVCLLGNHANR